MAGGKKRRSDDIHMTPDVSYISNPDVTHEESDVSVGPIAKFVGALFILLAVICVLMLLMYNFLEKRAQESERRASPLARRGADALPPPPRLQGSKGFEVPVTTGTPIKLELREPQAEYTTVRQLWEEELKGYEWQDPEQKTARVPIETAIRLYAEQQARRQQPQPQQPSAPAGQQNPAPVEHGPSPASSGRAPEATHQ